MTIEEARIHAEQVLEANRSVNGGYSADAGLARQANTAHIVLELCAKLEALMPKPEPVEEAVEEDAAEIEAVPDAPKKRGRPKKVVTDGE